MRTLVSVMLLFAASSGLSMTSNTQDLGRTLLSTAYKTNADLAADADQNFARAMEIVGSKGSVGTGKEMLTAMNKAAVLG